jgi:hypothetical protein
VHEEVAVDTWLSVAMLAESLLAVWHRSSTGNRSVGWVSSGDFMQWRMARRFPAASHGQPPARHRIVHARFDVANNEEEIDG